ncbi:MAG: hypothetical protein WD844_13750 [Thermoleophilaceae bacterium]
MQVLVVTMVGLVWWICAWAFGVKSFDAFMLTVGMVVVSASVYIFKPYVDRLLGRRS